MCSLSSMVKLPFSEIFILLELDGRMDVVQIKSLLVII